MSAAHELEDDGFRPIGLGHNSAKNLRGMLLEQYAPLMRRAEELLAALDRLPEIDDDDALGKVSDFIKQISACTKTFEGARVAEKQPFLQAGSDVDGVFNTVKDKLDKAKAWVSKRVTIYLNEKARIEQEARAAEERRRAEESRRAEEERRKAEQARREAEARARLAEQEALEQRTRAERDRIAAEERHKRELAAAEARAHEEETKRRQSDANREKAQAEAARLRQEAADRAERERREAEERAQREAEEAERRRVAADEEARRLADEETARNKAAEEAEAQRLLAEKEALAKPADMARTRSDMGSMATLQAVWTFTVDDRDAIDFNQLRAYFSAEAFEKAVKAAIRNGIRPDAQGNQPLAGIRIFQTNKAAVR